MLFCSLSFFHYIYIYKIHFFKEKLLPQIVYKRWWCWKLHFVWFIIFPWRRLGETVLLFSLSLIFSPFSCMYSWAGATQHSVAVSLVYLICNCRVAPCRYKSALFILIAGGTIVARDIPHSGHKPRLHQPRALTFILTRSTHYVERSFGLIVVYNE